MEKVAQLDLKPIAYKLMHPDEGEGWARERIIQAVGMYRKHLVLNGTHPEQAIVPTPDVDIVWHTHMSDSAKYRADCNYLFGAFLDHFPYFGIRDEDDAKDLKRSFAKTRKLYVEVFGHDPCVESVSTTSLRPRSCIGNGCHNDYKDEKRPTVDFLV